VASSRSRVQSYRRTAMCRRPAIAIATVTPAQALEATRLAEELIVEKVFREGLTGTLGTSEASAAIGEILHPLIFGSSEEAARSKGTSSSRSWSG
jgi:hypothetical protein